ncbi:MAG: tol-pal system protein YbgF [Pedobacter sp.]|nr:tol-pal system protein YbgF [Pedobacter sp.]
MLLNSRFHRSALLLALLASSGLHAEIVVEDRPLSSAPKPVAAAKPAPAPAAVEAPVQTDSSNSGWDSYNQLQQLQEELGRLRGTVEEQAHLIEKLQTDLRTRYTDLDQRFNALQEQVKQAAAAGPAAASTDAAAAPSATIEEEKKAYLAAYETFRTGGPDKAIPPMLAFVKRYPNSTFTPGAYYWLGEFYLNASTPDQASAQKHFETVLTKYPDHAKAPAALYKLGSIQDLQGKPQEAKKKMQELVAKYPKSPEAGLADSYLKALAAAEAPAAKPAAKPESKPAAKPAAKTPAKKS